jgi:hypothetical protein
MNKKDEKTFEEKSILFIDFLRRENVLEKYAENMRSYRGAGDSTPQDDTETYLKGMLKRCFSTAYNFLYAAFKWCDAKEGGDFWIDISSKWNDALSKIESEQQKASKQASKRGEAVRTSNNSNLYGHYSNSTIGDAASSEQIGG